MTSGWFGPRLARWISSARCSSGLPSASLPPSRWSTCTAKGRCQVRGAHACCSSGLAATVVACSKTLHVHLHCTQKLGVKKACKLLPLHLTLCRTIYRLRERTHVAAVPQWHLLSDDAQFADCKSAHVWRLCCSGNATGISCLMVHIGCCFCGLYHSHNKLHHKVHCSAPRGRPARAQQGQKQPRHTNSTTH